ncbi:MAG TPA: PepSY-like domain-containing protein [Bacteroidia bacterium]|jgi:hypothetical protein|nr:PepSY-like domain-containing protein [Bacteroidia bacterium]
MKKITLLIIGCFCLTFLPAQEKKSNKLDEAAVPASVKSKFAALYPGIKAEKWENENGNFEAKFHQNKTEMSVLLAADGNLLETETEIKVSELPKSVTDYIAKNKPGKKIKEASKIVDTKGVMTYEAEIEHTDLIFDKNGNFLKEAKG